MTKRLVSYRRLDFVCSTKHCQSLAVFEAAFCDPTERIAPYSSEYYCHQHTPDWLMNNINSWKDVAATPPGRS